MLIVQKNNQEGNDIIKQVYSTYVVINNEKRNTRDLTEEEILALIENDIEEYMQDMEAYSKKKGNGLLGTFDLLANLPSDFKLSAKGVLYLLKLEKKFGHIVVGVLNGLTNMELINQAMIIAKFLKETSGNFSDITLDDIYLVIEQMVVNDEKKQNKTSKTYSLKK